MPHIIVKLHKGRDAKVKQDLSDEIVKKVLEVIQCPESAISVAFDEFDPENWAEEVYKPDILGKQELLTQKPGYNPFEK